MGRCLAPCSESLQTELHHERYMEVVNEVKLFLQGERKELLSHLQNSMQRLSNELRFEEAAKLRDRLRAIERVWETQRVISPELGDMDVIGLYREDANASVFMLFIRNGMVIGQKGFMLKKLSGLEEEEIISNFIGQFYSKDILIPPKIILPIKGEFKTQRQWLSEKREGPVALSYPVDEKEKEVLKMALDNARQSYLAQTGKTIREDVISLKRLLNLKRIPRRIGAIDVSNIAGTEAVGALVVWEDGRFCKEDYRLFKIKTVEGIDDFAMIEEVVKRHLTAISQKGETPPDLLLIDGGKGQLESALNATKPFDLKIEIAAIAKAKEELPDRIFLPGRKDAIPLEPSMSLTLLLQRIRDEAHRFAIKYHKKLRKKRVIESPLEKIKGVGKARRLTLLRHFGSIDAIRKASIEEIASLKGMNKKIAELIKMSL
jgi:excinuclease ABC subunit C